MLTLPKYSIWPQTLRAPSTSLASAVSRNDLVSGNLDALQTYQQQNLYKLFTFDDQFNVVGNPEWDPSAQVGAYNSFESVHDQVHGYIRGHMGDIRVSSFDPIFWLHHA